MFAYRAGRSFYISSLPAEVTHPDAATAAFDIITRYVERGIQTLLALGVVLFVVAWMLGPVRPPSAFAAGGSGCAPGVRPKCPGVEPGPVAAWIAGHRNELRFAVVALAVISLLLWERPTGRVVVLLTLLTVLILAVISVLAGAAPSTHSDERPDRATDRARRMRRRLSMLARRRRAPNAPKCRHDVDDDTDHDDEHPERADRPAAPLHEAVQERRPRQEEEPEHGDQAVLDRPSSSGR